MGKQWSGALCALEAEVMSDGRIGAEDALKLRRAVYQKGSIGREEAAFLFHLNRRAWHSDPAWSALYVEALTDFFYWGEGADSRLTEDAERMLLEWLGPASRLDDPSELRLLLNLTFRTSGASETFRRFVLETVRHGVLHGAQALFGDQERCPGVIDRADVEVMRRLVYGRDGPNGVAVGQAEAEFLFRLNGATAGAPNHPAWRELFVKAIAMHLLCGGSSPEAIDEDEAHWLIGQIEADGVDHDNERALLGYLRQEASRLHPVLDPLCRRLGL